MKGKYVGRLSRQDPLYGFLVNDILKRIGVYEVDPEFRVFRAVASNEVYTYEETHSQACVIIKFFGKAFGWDRHRAAAAQVV